MWETERFAPYPEKCHIRDAVDNPGELTPKLHNPFSAKMLCLLIWIIPNDNNYCDDNTYFSTFSSQIRIAWQDQEAVAYILKWRLK